MQSCLGLVWSSTEQQCISTQQEKYYGTTLLITSGTGRVTNATASLAARSLLILALPPEDPDDPDESSASASSSVPKSDSSSTASSSEVEGLGLPPSPSNTIFLATSVIPCARISVETPANNRSTFRRAFSALAKRAAYLSLRDVVPCPLQLETAS